MYFFFLKPVKINIPKRAIVMHAYMSKILTVGSDGNLFVNETKRQVLPTAPSPTTTHLIVDIAVVTSCFPASGIKVSVIINKYYSVFSGD